MRIDGNWRQDVASPNELYPALGGLLEIEGITYSISFLVDTGADCTVLGSNFAPLLASLRREIETPYLSAGGLVEGFMADLPIRFRSSTGVIVTFRASCIVLEHPKHWNTYLLGRDILDQFALICDQAADVVTLLRPPHTYQITP
jgi:hypothetical protein